MMWWLESQKKPPTSLSDLLAVEVGRMVGEEPRKLTNKSSRLIGGKGGCCGWGRRRKHHQVNMLVVMLGRVVGGERSVVQA